MPPIRTAKRTRVNNEPEPPRRGLVPVSTTEPHIRPEPSESEIPKVGPEAAVLSSKEFELQLIQTVRNVQEMADKVRLPPAIGGHTHAHFTSNRSELDREWEDRERILGPNTRKISFGQRFVVTE